MTTLATKPVYSLDAYLSNEEQSDVRHEYVAGSVYAMAGASERHHRIAVNILMRFRTETRGTRCGSFLTDMKLRLEPSQAVYHPDVMLVCDERDDHPFYKTSPCIVVEVLSPSTEGIDRREKRVTYQRIAALNGYVLAESESRSVEAFLRTGQGWAHVQLGEDQVLSLPCAGHTIGLTLDDIYEDVERLNRRPMTNS